jgi:hypothetical protein
VADLPDFAQLVTSLKLPETPATATTPPNPWYISLKLVYC